MAIYKYEDGKITTEYGKNFDGTYPDITFPSLEEIVQYIDNLNRWDDVEPKLYEELCEEVGLDSDDYDDYGDLMEDVRARIKPKRRLAIVSCVYRGEAAKKNGEGCDIFFDRLPEHFTLDQAIKKATTDWRAMHWRDRQKERLSLCVINDHTEDILDVIKDYE